MQADAAFKFNLLKRLGRPCPSNEGGGLRVWEKIGSVSSSSKTRSSKSNFVRSVENVEYEDESG